MTGEHTTTVEQPVGDDYIFIEGGIVQNEPSLPVFDLDVLDSDACSEDDAARAFELYKGIVEHKSARIGLRLYLSALAGMARSYGSAETVAELNTFEEENAELLEKIEDYPDSSL